MQLDLGPEVAAFRAEIRSWIESNMPQGLADLVDWHAPRVTGGGYDARDRALDDPRYAEWERRLLDAKLICPQWPEAVGGRGWDGVRVAVFTEECHRAGVPRVIRGMGEAFVGPSIIVHGTEEQKAHFLPRIISGEDVYCQGFSEPNQGCDLAGVETRGVVETGPNGDEVVVSGQKVWTSGAHRANMIFVLCRTDPDAPKHRGLSYVLVPMRDGAGGTNGVEIRPLPQMSGAAEFYEDFLDGARAPMFNVIGGLNNGWRVAMTTLGHERGGRASTAHLGFEREFWDLVDAARKYGNDRDPLARQRFAWAYTQVQLMRFSGLRTLARLAGGKEPGPESSITKLFWSEYHRSLGEIAMDVLGPDALVRPDGEGYPTDRWQNVFLASRAGTIYSGTSEIQRNIVGERALGLAKEPRVEERTPR